MDKKLCFSTAWKAMESLQIGWPKMDINEQKLQWNKKSFLVQSKNVIRQMRFDSEMEALQNDVSNREVSLFLPVLDES